jgi:hypothetical protein
MIPSDYLDRYEKIQRLENSVVRASKKDKWYAVAVFIAAMGVCSYIAQCDYKDRPNPAAMKAHATLTDKEWKMKMYFVERKNKTPEEMALAVLHTKNPRLLAAMNVAGEKNSPISSKKGGYKGAHKGAWQVNEQMHKKRYGKVPEHGIGQALQAERLLTDLTGSMPIEKALDTYGGDSRGHYSKRVLAELVKVP